MKVQLTKEQQKTLYAATFYENDKVFSCMINKISEWVLYCDQRVCVVGNRASELYDNYIKSMTNNGLINNQQGLSVESVEFSF
jgi:hypothetical protein